MKFEIESVFPAAPEEVARAVLDVELQAELYEALDYPRWQQTSRTEEADGGLHRVLDVTPPVALPGFIRSALGDATGYSESQIWAPDRLSYAWDVDFELSSRIDMTGRCTFEPCEVDGGDGCRRIIQAEIKVGIPLLGGRIAAYLRDETVKTQTQAAEALAQMLESQPEGLAE